MTIYDARRLNIDVNDVLKYNISDEEKLVYIFEKNPEAFRTFDIKTYYCLLGIANKYK